MRDSIEKVRKDCSVGMGYDDNTAQGISKWLGHVSAVLIGSISTAESILIGYPVLVHCSDGWDRTAQITSLAQILLDPYYRTIDGFLMLLEKEWVQFGHQFAHRLGKSTANETSPVFLQYIDCIWQIIQQFPTEFEYSESFLELIVICAYSGYFSSFRGNCVRERSSHIRDAVSYNHGVNYDDMSFSTVSSSRKHICIF